MPARTNAALIARMIAYERGVPHRAQHLLKVYALARGIALLEGVDADTLALLEAAALVHDIGIRPSLETYGSAAGEHQQREGPPLAEALLRELGYAPEVVERVCYLVAHHHTYTDIQGIDYQILVESDFLVNFHEGQMSPEAIRSVYEGIFRTEAGRAFCREMYGVDV